jgi:hypothetical protein
MLDPVDHLFEDCQVNRVNGVPVDFSCQTTQLEPCAAPKESVTAGLRLEFELQSGGTRKFHFCAQKSTVSGCRAGDRGRSE